MHFVRGAPRPVASVAILPGAFNPPTVAHLALIEAGRERAGQVICVVPRELPHKRFEGATFDERVQMLDRIAASGYDFDVAISDGGLFIEIARECRAAFQRDVNVAFLCGRDTAERITGWDYGYAGAINQMLEEFRLLVADRRGRFQPPPGLDHAIELLPGRADVDTISSTEIRRRIEQGEPWADLVPEAIHDLVGRIYERR
jgi:nicotinate (nicotinamide) nucleotide adenylyltransferase